ncbi:MAG: hypothetical protein ACRDVP_01165 [Acidimicrobiales bacterium]
MIPSDTEEFDLLLGRIYTLEQGLESANAAIHALGREVRTRQLVVVDDDDHPRIVGEVFGDVAELRLEMPASRSDPGPELVLFALGAAGTGPLGLGPVVGIQLRAQGRALYELEMWPDADGTWRPHVHISGT